jgi:hypothetical protein
MNCLQAMVKLMSISTHLLVQVHQALLRVSFNKCIYRLHSAINGPKQK